MSEPSAISEQKSAVRTAALAKRDAMPAAERQAAAEAVAARVQNAGAIFLGAWSPVSLGDYAAGSNHVLPTGGSSRHSAALSVMTFLRPTQVVNYDLVGLRAAAPTVLALAAAEGLWAHGDAVSVRTDTERPRTSQP